MEDRLHRKKGSVSFLSLWHTPGQELAKHDYSTERACGIITRSRCDGDKRVIGPKHPNYIREPTVS